MLVLYAILSMYQYQILKNIKKEWTEATKNKKYDANA